MKETHSFTSRRLARYGAFALAMFVAVAAHGQTAEIRVVVLGSPSGGDTTATLPTTAAYMRNDAVFVAEVWAQTANANGLSSVSADITFTTALADVTAITHAATFNVLTHGSIDNSSGLINDLSGSHLGPCTDAVGVAPNWARAAILTVAATANGTLTFQSGPTGSAIYGTAICGVGDIADAQMNFGSVTVTLVDCVTDGDCGDGLYCNGLETCNPATHICQAGTAPNCDDGVACTIDTCNETSDSCDHSPNDAFCDNGLWCDGAETCHVTLGCQPGVDPCTDACEHCDEDADTCEWCVLDLDANAVMGTGDFARFTGCFGGCYLPADPCYQSNFDGSVDGCVGSSDFAAFAGCFGFTCAECVACGGPAGSAVASTETSLTVTPLSNVAIRVAVVEQPSVSDVVAAPPPSVIYTNVGRVLFVELWASRKDCLPGDSGLAAVYVDLDYDPQLLSMLEVVPDSLFSNFAGGMDNGKGAVSQFGGCAALGERELGVGTWVRVATLRVRTKASGRGALSSRPSDALHGVAILGDFENVPIDRIEFGRATIKTQQAKEIGSQLLRRERSR